MPRTDAETRPVRPEDVAARPLVGLLRPVAAAMAHSEVSILAVHVQRNELKSRMELTDIVNRRRMRHAHMVNITRQIMLEGMRADYHKVDRLSSKVLDLVKVAHEVRATTRAGSNFTATLNPGYARSRQRPHQPRQVGQSSGW